MRENSTTTRRQANAGILAAGALRRASGVAAALEAQAEGPAAATKRRQAIIDRGTPLESGAPRANIPIGRFREGWFDSLWAAFGVNRPTNDGRTVPYWRHVMVIDVYLAMAMGAWL